MRRCNNPRWGSRFWCWSGTPRCGWRDPPSRCGPTRSEHWTRWAWETNYGSRTPCWRGKIVRPGTSYTSCAPTRSECWMRWAWGSSCGSRTPCWKGEDHDICWMPLIFYLMQPTREAMLTYVNHVCTGQSSAAAMAACCGRSSSTGTATAAPTRCASYAADHLEPCWSSGNTECVLKA